MARQHYKIRNWSDYNKALVKRGSLTLWFDEKAINQWHKADKIKTKGRPRCYSDIAIECMLTLKTVFALPLRATQGLVDSLINLLHLPIKTADYTTLCRRQKTLSITLKQAKKNESLHAVFDATGLKVFGEGEWKVRQHGYSKRRTWRKLHLAIDEKSKEIIAAALSTNNMSDGELFPDLITQIANPLKQVSADGAYDSLQNYQLAHQRGAKITIPPRKNAKIRQHGNAKKPPLARDQIIRQVRKLGQTQWKKKNNYYRRNIAETTIFRIKQLFGSYLNARSFENQAVEAFIKCQVLNKMTALGMPDSYLVAA